MKSPKFDIERVAVSYPDDSWVLRRRRMTPPSDAPDEGPYNFTQTYPDVRSLALAIAMHGDDLVGVELGLYRAESFCFLLQVCPNIKTLYGVDSWMPYADVINPEGSPKVMDPKAIDLARLTAFNYIHYSGEEHRAVVIEEDTLKAVDRFEDESLDFVFCDAHLSGEQLLAEMEAYYPKTKNGGLFAGHDWSTRPTRDAVRQFRQAHGIDQTMACYDDTFVWKK